jgi:hypothetical protein
MSTFIRRYSNYLTKKAHTYTEAGLDFCRVSRGWVKNIDDNSDC